MVRQLIIEMNLIITSIVLISCVFVFGKCQIDENHTEGILQEYLTIVETRKKYDLRLPPFGYNTGTPIPVKLGFFVNAIGEIDDVNMEFLINIYLRQTWIDERMAFESELPGVESISLPDQVIDRMWVPDTYIENGKEEFKHIVTVPNRLFRVSSDGTIFFSQRLTLKLWCSLYLYYFPMDDQACETRFMSYRYTERELKLDWFSNKAVELFNDIPLAKFVLDGVLTGNCPRRFTTGNYSCLSAKFLFSREFGYYFVQIYIPSALIVLLSWVSFWLDPLAVPARISLGVLTVLTMSTQMSSAAGSSLPKVSYVKAIDVWLTTCMCFLFAALVEFAICNSFARFIMRKRMEYSSLEITEETIDEATLPPPGMKIIKEPHQRVSISRKISGNSLSPVEEVNDCHPKRKTGTMDFFCRLKAVQIDFAARILFPVLFLIFNVVYWLTYSRKFR